MTGPTRITGSHRDTLEHLFRHPLSHNVEWHAVLSLLRHVGEVTERHDGKLEIRVGERTIVVNRRAGKDLDAQQVVDIRDLLAAAGYGAEAEDGPSST